MTTKPSIWEAVLRGGQTATHTLEMTRETIQKSLIWTLLPILLVDLFLISRNMPSAAMGALLQKVEAGICQNVGFPLPQKLGITYPDGTVVTLPVKYIAQDPYINFESKIATDQLIRGMWFAIFMTGLAFCGLWFYYKHVGNKKILTRKIRGQKVTTAPLLVEAIEEHNEKAREKRNAQDSKDVKIGDVPYPYLTERNHTIVSGTTGMGKTVLISSLIDTIRGRGDKAVILDNEGTYVKRYFNPATDIVLNPLDARTANWDPFLDAQSPEDWSTLAASIFKSPPGDDPYWVESARSIFQWTAITLSMKPETSNVGELLKYLFGETSDLKNLLKGTPAYSHFSSGEGQSNRVDSLKSVIANEVTPLILLTGVEADFSLRDWLVPAEEKAAAKAKEEARAAARANVAIRQNEAVSTESFSSRLVIAIRNFADDFGSAPKLWWDGVRQKSAPEVVQTETPADPVEQGGFLFLTAPEDQLDSLRKLLSFWCELAVITLLSRPEDHPVFDSGLDRNRKFPCRNLFQILTVSAHNFVQILRPIDVASLSDLAVFPQERLVFPLSRFAGGQTQNGGRRVFLSRKKRHPVQLEKEHSENKSCSLIAVDKGVILNDACGVSGRQTDDICLITVG